MPHLLKKKKGEKEAPLQVNCNIMLKKKTQFGCF